MLDRAWGGMFPQKRSAANEPARASSRVARRPQVESLEGRVVMNAAIGSIPNVSVPASLGYQVALDGSGSNAPTQTYTATSSNPNIKVTTAQGQFLTLNLSHTAAAGVPNDVTFSGPVTFQLFQDLTPNTANLIAGFTEQGYYNGKTIHRIASDFSGKGGPTDYVMQGGAPNPDGTGSSGLPGTPYGLELNQQLAFVNPGSLAIANTGQANSNDTQFFWTTGPQENLDFNYTIFGQVVAGQETILQMEQVATEPNPGLGGESSKPISPVTITSAVISDTNPNGVIHVNAMGATPGETSTVQVTATDPSTNTTAVQTFQVSVIADATKHPNTLTFTPLVYPVTQDIALGKATTVQLKAVNNNPNNAAVTTQYALVTQPAHGTLTQLNATAGTVLYTPNAGFSGTDSFQYTANNLGGTPSPLAGNTNTVTLNVSAQPVVPVNTGAVRLIGTTFIVNSPPTGRTGSNTIVVGQTSNPSSPASEKLVVSVNGVTDALQPLASSVNRIIVYGSKASDTLTITSDVDASIPVFMDGGRGHGRNTLQAAAGDSRLHGWYGASNTLKAGAGANNLIGRAGLVKFVPNSASKTIFAGRPNPGYTNFHSTNGHTTVTLNPPGGTFYRFSNGRLIPLPTPKPAPVHPR